MYFHLNSRECGIFCEKKYTSFPHWIDIFGLVPLESSEQSDSKSICITNLCVLIIFGHSYTFEIFKKILSGCSRGQSEIFIALQTGAKIQTVHWLSNILITYMLRFIFYNIYHVICENDKKKRNQYAES